MSRKFRIPPPQTQVHCSGWGAGPACSYPVLLKLDFRDKSSEWKNCPSRSRIVCVCAVLAIICGLVTSFPAAEVLWRRTTLSPALYLAESWIKLGRFTRICSSGPYRFCLVFIPEDTACSRPSRFREADNRRHSFPFGGVVVVSFEETLAKRQKNKWIYSLFLCSKRQMVSTLMCSCLGVFVFCWLVCFLLSPQWLALPINGNRKAELLRPLEQMFSACLLSRKLKVEFHPWDYSWISEVRAMQIS